MALLKTARKYIGQDEVNYLKRNNDDESSNPKNDLTEHEERVPFHKYNRDDFGSTKGKLLRRHTDSSITGLNIRDKLKRWVTNPGERKKSPTRYNTEGGGFVSHQDSIENLRGRRISPNRSRRLVELDYPRSRSTSREEIRAGKIASRTLPRLKNHQSDRRVSEEMPPMPQLPAKRTSDTGDSRSALTRRHTGPSKPIVIRPPNPWSNIPRNNQNIAPDDQIVYIQKMARGRPVIMRPEERDSGSRTQVVRTQSERDEADRQMMLKAQQEYGQREAVRKESTRAATVRETSSRPDPAKTAVNKPMWAGIRRNNPESPADKDKKEREQRAIETQTKADRAEKERKEREKKETEAKRLKAARDLKAKRAELLKRQPTREIKSPENSVREHTLLYRGNPPQEPPKTARAASTRRRDTLPAKLSAANLESRNDDFVPGVQASTLNRGLGDMTRTFLEGMASPEDIDAWTLQEKNKRAKRGGI